MELAIPPFSYAPIAKHHHTLWTNAFTSVPNDTRKGSKRLVSSFTSTTNYSTPTESLDFELENKKHDLLRAVQETKRGLNTTPDLRSSIEEALVTVEGYDAGKPIDLDKLDGTWRLQYTSAPDVLVLFEAAERFPFLEVGQIFQKFECKNQAEKAVVRNVIRWSIRNVLEEQEGATLLVSAKFSVVSRRNIYLQFEEISLQDIKISEELQAIIAPAVLPRSFLNLQEISWRIVLPLLLGQPHASGSRCGWPRSLCLHSRSTSRLLIHTRIFTTNGSNIVWMLFTSDPLILPAFDHSQHSQTQRAPLLRFFRSQIYWKSRRMLQSLVDTTSIGKRGCS